MLLELLFFAIRFLGFIACQLGHKLDDRSCWSTSHSAYAEVGKIWRSYREGNTWKNILLLNIAEFLFINRTINRLKITKQIDILYGSD